MSEDRAQAPSRRRREQARARGMVPRSAELSAAVGVLSAVLLLGAWGPSLANGLVALIQGVLKTDPAVAAGAPGALRQLAPLLLSVALPLGGILGGTVLAMVLAHVLQTGGLWAPGLLAPDVSRLWGGPRTGWGRGLFGLLRTVVLAVAAGLMLRADWPAVEGLSRLDARGILAASGSLARGFGSSMALALLFLGVLDFVRQYRAVEARLRMTDQEHREDQKTEDGDPELRAKRMRLARSWLKDPAEGLKGASVVLTAPGGLCVAVGGGPPPKPVLVRQVARGASGSALKRAAERKDVPRATAPEIARHLAAGRVLAPEMVKALADLWPQAHPLKKGTGTSKTRSQSPI